MVSIKNFVMPEECKLCPFAIPTKRRFGITWACQAEITFMDVTYCYNNGQKSKLCPLVEDVPIIKENITVVDQNKTLDEQGLPSCWTCEFYDVDFGICNLFMRENIDLAENTCCTVYKEKK